MARRKGEWLSPARLKVEHFCMDGVAGKGWKVRGVTKRCAAVRPGAHERPRRPSRRDAAAPLPCRPRCRRLNQGCNFAFMKHQPPRLLPTRKVRLCYVTPMVLTDHARDKQPYYLKNQLFFRMLFPSAAAETPGKSVLPTHQRTGYSR